MSSRRSTTGCYSHQSRAHDDDDDDDDCNAQNKQTNKQTQGRKEGRKKIVVGGGVCGVVFLSSLFFSKKKFCLGYIFWKTLNQF
jgi:hypothetical protein